MRLVIRREVDVAAPAATVWGYVTDWPRQGEWIPLTKVERVDGADSVGGRFRAWTGVGPIGFWDTMTISTWQVRPDGSGLCEVMHTGRLVRGDGQFEVLALTPDTSRFILSELIVLPMGKVGWIGWRVVRPLVERAVDRLLAQMRARAERLGG
jgi:hypothetical protein